MVSQGATLRLESGMYLIYASDGRFLGIADRLDRLHRLAEATPREVYFVAWYGSAAGGLSPRPHRFRFMLDEHGVAFEPVGRIPGRAGPSARLAAAGPAADFADPEGPDGAFPAWLGWAVVVGMGWAIGWAVAGF